MLQQCGVRYLGFPLRLPVHREDLTEQEAAAIIKSLAPPVFGVAITYLYEATEIAAFCHALGARIVQLHGDIERDELKRLKTLDPNITVIKSLIIGMRDHKALEATLRELLPFVHAFITDTLDPKTGASGAELAPMRPVFLNMIQRQGVRQTISRLRIDKLFAVPAGLCRA